MDMGRISNVVRRFGLFVGRLTGTLRPPSSRLLSRRVFDVHGRVTSTADYLKAGIPHLHSRLRSLTAKLAAPAANNPQ
jgi:hypothetical protein